MIPYIVSTMSVPFMSMGGLYGIVGYTNAQIYFGLIKHLWERFLFMMIEEQTYYEDKTKFKHL